MNEKIKPIIKSIIFILILLIILILLSILFVPKNNTVEAGMEKSRDLAVGIYSEPKNTIDVLVVGDSESYSSFIPLEVWHNYGITSFVCGTPAQPLPMTISFVKDALKTQSPQIVLLEANTLYRRKKFTEPIKEIVGNILPVFQYHNRWKSLNAQDWTGKIEYTFTVEEKGYYYSDDQVSIDAKDYMEEDNAKSKIPQANKFYVKYIKKLCEDKGATMIMYNAPSAKNWSYRKHNGIVEFAKELGVEYIDMNTIQNKIPINWQTETRDQGDHLNYDGALKATKYIGKFLNNKKILPDHRKDPAYQSWNELYDKYIKKINNKGE